MLVMGIDSGLTGALSFISYARDVSRFEVVQTWPMPIVQDRSGSYGAAKQVDASAVLDRALAMRRHGFHKLSLDRLHVVIERQQAMPKQGVSSSFNNGMNYGLILGALRASTQFRDHIWGVRGSMWKKDMGLSSSKAESRAMATTLFGSDAGEIHWPRPSHEGRAEAALIAYWRGMRLLQAGVIT